MIYLLIIGKFIVLHNIFECEYKFFFFFFLHFDFVLEDTERVPK